MKKTIRAIIAITLLIVVYTTAAPGLSVCIVAWGLIYATKYAIHWMGNNKDGMGDAIESFGPAFYFFMCGATVMSAMSLITIEL